MISFVDKYVNMHIEYCKKSAVQNKEKYVKETVIRDS